MNTRILVLVVLLAGMVCPVAGSAGVIAWWRMQEAASGFAGPGGQPPEAFTNEVSDTPDRWLDDKVSNPQYAVASMPVAPGGVAVPGNTAYSTGYNGGQGLFDPDPGFLNAAAYTWEVFYRRGGVEEAGNFYGNDNASHFNGISRVGVNADGDVVLQLTGNDSGVSSGNTPEEFVFTAPDDDGWHHFAFTFSGGILQGFVDYQLAGTHVPQFYTNGQIFTDYTFLTVGFANEILNASLNAYWTGDLDELRISDEVLAPGELLGGALVEVGFTQATVDAVVGFEFTSLPFTDYVLQYAAQPATNDWVDTPFTIHGTGSVMQFFDPTGFSTQKVYRLLQQ